MNDNFLFQTSSTAAASSLLTDPANPSTTLKTRGFGFESPVQGQTNNWLTPPELLRRLGEFAMDPCGCPGSPWQTATKTYFLPQHDGLVEPWEGRVWCNPPYGPQVGEWAQRMCQHADGIMLIFARLETSTWQKHIFPFADAVLFLHGRVHFCLASGQRGGSGTAPSALVGYGQSNVKALKNAGIAGAFSGGAEMLHGIRASEF